MPEFKPEILVDKAVEACLAAIEAYNKPISKYREESFAILMINGWELLLKARIIQESRGKSDGILVWKNRSGGKGGRIPKTTRSGNQFTIGLTKAIRIVKRFEGGIDNECHANIVLLQEIRNSAIHFINASGQLGLAVHRVGTAALRNFVLATQKWFGYDFSQFNIFLMPLAFDPLSGFVQTVESIRHPQAVSRVLDLITRAEQKVGASSSEGYNVTFHIDLTFAQATDRNAAHAQIVRGDPDAPKLNLSEDQLRDRYPWDYAELVERMRDRFPEFKLNQRFHDIRIPLEADLNLCWTRYLDHRNQRGGTKKFYNPNILRHFDGHYSTEPKDGDSD